MEIYRVVNLGTTTAPLFLLFNGAQTDTGNRDFVTCEGCAGFLPSTITEPGTATRRP
jgi:hypothetical protein